MLPLWIGLYTAHLILKARTWYGEMHLMQCNVDAILIVLILIFPANFFKTRISNRSKSMIESLNILFYALIPAFITRSVIISIQPVRSTFILFAIGTFIPSILYSITSAPNTLKKIQYVTLYAIGRLFTFQTLFYPLSFLFLYTQTSKNQKSRKLIMIVSLLLLNELPNYMLSSDIQTLHSIYSQNSTIAYPFKLLDSEQSLTGLISIVEDASIEGGIRVMKCDHSILGGIYLLHDNVSIFHVFYMMDFVRYMGLIETSNNPKRALVM